MSIPGARARCLDAYGLAIAIPAANLGLDVAVALLPVRMILTISLPGRSKAMILVMLGLGALAEVTIGLVCINAPALRPLLKRLSGNTSKPSDKSTVDTRSSGGYRGGESIALGPIQRPDKTKSRSRSRDDGTSSVEQFRPNDVNCTITEIGTEEHGYVGCQYHDQVGENSSDHEDSIGCECTHGILRKMEVAVTVSDRV
ncbi:hypothetical protein Q9L58_004450 [Maublancomyces gigas]|uniref:Rhodopsin domain-containing protein n=1 Tax=Discina gigas TaxID=1032678 RepID=A0ABR3GKZ9_9PEZI